MKATPNLTMEERLNALAHAVATFRAEEADEIGRAILRDFEALRYELEAAITKDHEAIAADRAIERALGRNEAMEYAVTRLALLREVMNSDLPRLDQDRQGYGRILRDELIERIRDHLRDTTHGPDSPTGRDKALKTPSSAGSTPAPGTNSAFSDFIRNAEGDERREVFERVIDKSIERQNATMQGNEIGIAYRHWREVQRTLDLVPCEDVFTAGWRAAQCHSQ
jgi:hypothetical protein